MTSPPPAHRVPTTRFESDHLASECQAAWKLANDGSWLELHGADDAEERWEMAANALAASVHGLDVGARMVAESGNVTLVATRAEDGVLIGLRDRRGNPITMLSALHRIETRVRSRVDLPPLAESLEESTHALTSSEYDREIPETHSIRRTVEYLNMVLETAARHVKRATLCEFWVRSLEGSELRELVGFTCEDGFELLVSDRGLTRDESGAFDEAFAGWKLRVRLAMGPIYEKLPGLKMPPWRQ